MSDELQVEPEHYQRRRYDKLVRFISYWHQADQVLKREPAELLEIGIGNGFLSRYLRTKGVTVHTVDVDERLGPDTVASVVDLPFEDQSFDMVACFETLEHLPWDRFAPAAAELRRVAKRWVMLSLPDASPYLRVDIEGPGKRRIQRFKELPYPRPQPHEYDGEHHWEIGKASYPLRRILAELGAAGLEVEERLRVFELPYHHFLSCRRR